jgi:hypothetical protein
MNLKNISKYRMFAFLTVLLLTMGVVTGAWAESLMFRVNSSQTGIYDESVVSDDVEVLWTYEAEAEVSGSPAWSDG